MQRKIRDLALRSTPILYLYCAGIIAVSMAPIALLWILLYGIGCR